MKCADAFPSNYLAHADLPRPLSATIAKLVIEQLRSPSGLKKRPVLYFAKVAGEPHAKPLILNKTNWRIIEKAHGDSDLWPGRPVEIYWDPSVCFGKEQTGGVRVRVRDEGPETRGEQKATPEQIQRAVSLLASAGKSELAACNWAAPGKSTLRELTFQEAEQLIGALRKSKA